MQRSRQERKLNPKEVEDDRNRSKKIFNSKRYSEGVPSNQQKEDTRARKGTSERKDDRWAHLRGKDSIRSFTHTGEEPAQFLGFG